MKQDYFEIYFSVIVLGLTTQLLVEKKDEENHLNLTQLIT